MVWAGKEVCSDALTLAPHRLPVTQTRHSCCRMELTLVHYRRALELGGGVAKPPNWAGSPLEQLLLSPPPGPASGPY